MYRAMGPEERRAGLRQIHRPGPLAPRSPGTPPLPPPRGPRSHVLRVGGRLTIPLVDGAKGLDRLCSGLEPLWKLCREWIHSDGQTNNV